MDCEQEISVLSWLLGNIELEQFMEEYWEKKPYIISGRGEHFFDELIQMDIIDQILPTYLNSPKLFEMADARRPRSQRPFIPKNEYLFRNFSGESRDLLDFDKIYRLYEDGTSIFLRRLEERIEGIDKLTKEVADNFNAEVQTNVYITPPNAQGFASHYDSFDAIMLQMEGTKRWIIYKPTYELPKGEHLYHPDEHDMGEVYMDFVLEKGDVMYLPRGWGHKVISNDDTSAHAQLVMKVVTWSDLLKKLIEANVSNHELLREEVPLYQDISVQKLELIFGQLRGTLINQDIIRHTITGDDYERLYNRVPRRLDFFRRIGKKSSLNMKSTCIYCERSGCQLFDSADGIVLMVQQNVVRIPEEHLHAYKYVFAQKQFEIDDISTTLEAPIKLDIVKGLFDLGVVRTPVSI